MAMGRRDVVLWLLGLKGEVGRCGGLVRVRENETSFTIDFIL